VAPLVPLLPWREDHIVSAPAARRSLDTETMREVAQHLLGAHAEVPTEDVVRTPARGCRGIPMPEVNRHTSSGGAFVPHRQPSRYQGMTRTHTVGMLALLTAGFMALAASPVAATSVIGFGNAAYDNACANVGGPRAGGATKQHSGIITGLGVALPASSPGNQCGTLGLPTALHEMGGVDVVGTLTGGEL
jgi:hypothetical protein